MNRVEFVQDLITRGVYDRVGVVRQALEQADHDNRIAELGASLYLVPVVEKIFDDTGTEVTKTGHITITVYDPGTPEEVVQWEGKVEPGFQARPADTAFVDAVIAWYAVNKPASVVKFEVVEANKDIEFAVLRVFDVNTGTATESRKLIYKDGASISVADLV